MVAVLEHVEWHMRSIDMELGWEGIFVLQSSGGLSMLTKKACHEICAVRNVEQLRAKQWG